jgi:hypothetical protein
VDQSERPRAQVETPSWLAMPEHNPGHWCIRVIKPQIGDPGSGVILVTGNPCRVTELAALQFDGQSPAWTSRPVTKSRPTTSRSAITPPTMSTRQQASNARATWLTRDWPAKPDPSSGARVLREKRR